MLYRITYQTQNQNQIQTEIDASSVSEAKAEFNRTWFGGPVTIIKVDVIKIDSYKTDSYKPFILPENPDAELIEVGDRVVCIYDNLSDLRIGKEYIVIQSGPGKDYDIFVKDAITDIKDSASRNASRSRRRFKIVRPATTKKGLAPGLTLLDVRGRKGLAPSLKS